MVAVVLWLFWFVLNTIFQQEPFQKRRNNLSRAGSLAKHGGNTGGSAASGDPSENGFGPSERGLVRTPRGSLPGKAALGPAGTLFNGRQRFPIVTITGGANQTRNPSAAAAGRASPTPGPGVQPGSSSRHPPGRARPLQLRAYGRSRSSRAALQLDDTFCTAFSARDIQKAVLYTFLIFM